MEPAPSTPTHPPRSALKRSASTPFGPVTAVTPKQAKTSISSSPSPSIKMWLKRSASAPSSGTLFSGKGACGGSDFNGSIDSRLDEPVICSPAKTRNIETDEKTETKLADKDCEKPQEKDDKQGTVGNRSTQDLSVRKSCKRKLMEECSPQKSKKQRLNCDIDSDSFSVKEENKENVLIENKRKSTSPVKRKNPDDNQTLKSDLNNKSPDKNLGENSLMFNSPARISLKEQDSNVYQSPTANLPNSVIDGPQRKVDKPDNEDGKQKSVDWLTEMRIQKLAKRSPREKKCRSKLLDKLSDSSGSESSQEMEKTSSLSPRVKVGNVIMF